MKMNRIMRADLASIATRCVTAVAVCVLALGPAFAFDGDGRDEKVGALDTGAGIGDETIGTLPILHGNTIELVRGLPILRPSLFLEGDLYELQNAITFFHGSGRAEVVPLDPSWQRVRLVFVDETMLALDRVSLLGADIQFGVWMPEKVRCANPSLAWGGRTFDVAAINSRLALPLSQMSAAGALDNSPLCVSSTSAQGANALVAGVDQDFLYLVQRH